MSLLSDRLLSDQYAFMHNMLDQTTDAADNALQEASTIWLLIKETDEGRAYIEKAKLLPSPDASTMTTGQLSQFVNYQDKKLSRVVNIDLKYVFFSRMK